MNDNSIMPDGNYKGWKLCDVPAAELLRIFGDYEGNIADTNDEVVAYIFLNLKAITLEYKQAREIKYSRNRVTPVR